MAILVGAGIAAVGTVAGGAIASSGARSAARTAANAATSAAQVQQNMFDTTQADIAPQIALGKGAANMLSGIYGLGPTSGTGAPAPAPNYSSFYDTPGYTFSLNQGENAINRAASANGSLYSTNTLTSLNNFAQGTASTQYNNYVNQLLTMAGLGNAANQTGATAATAAGGQIGSSLISAGNANASGVLGSSNAFSNALGSLSNNKLIQNAFSPDTSVVNPDNLPINYGNNGSYTSPDGYTIQYPTTTAPN
jgi:hypothetical protein